MTFVVRRLCNSKSPTVGKRWETSIDHERKQRTGLLEEEKQRFQEQVYCDASQALPMDNHVSGLSQLFQSSQNRTSILRNDGKSVGKEGTLVAHSMRMRGTLFVGVIEDGSPGVSPRPKCRRGRTSHYR